MNTVSSSVLNRIQTQLSKSVYFITTDIIINNSTKDILFNIDHLFSIQNELPSLSICYYDLLIDMITQISIKLSISSDNIDLYNIQIPIFNEAITIKYIPPNEYNRTIFSFCSSYQSSVFFYIHSDIKTEQKTSSLRKKLFVLYDNIHYMNSKFKITATFDVRVMSSDTFSLEGYEKVVIKEEEQQYKGETYFI